MDTAVPGKMDGVGVFSLRLVGLSVLGLTPSQPSLPIEDEDGANESLRFADGGSNSKIFGPTSKGTLFQNFLSIPMSEALLDVTSLRNKPATVAPVTLPPNTTATAATAIANCTEIANPTAGTAAVAITVEPVQTETAALWPLAMP